MKLGNLKVKVFTAVDAATLEAAVNTFLAGLTEETFVGLHFAADAVNGLHIVISYTG